MRALRDLAGDGRLILFGPATMELLSRKMLQFGCDDYLLLPADPAEIQQVFGSPALRLAGGDAGAAGSAPADPSAPPATALPATAVPPRPRRPSPGCRWRTCSSTPNSNTRRTRSPPSCAC